MDSSLVLYLGRHTLETALMLAAPLLISDMIVGITITLLQTITSIRDMTLTIVPKLLTLGVMMLLFGSWMLQVTLRFTTEVFALMQNIGH
jgi:flagellar biosynthetic protein FliQ